MKPQHIKVGTGFCFISRCGLGQCTGHQWDGGDLKASLRWLWGLCAANDWIFAYVYCFTEWSVVAFWLN